MSNRTSEAPQEPQAATEPILVPPPDFDSIIAAKVADAVSAVLPQLVTMLSQTQIAAPSPSVQVTPASTKNNLGFGHYRKDGVTVGKHQEFDMDCIDAGTDINTCAKKGSWVIFTNGHNWPESRNQARQLEWMMANDPYCGVYRDDGGSVIPCPVANCVQFFSNETGLKGHMAATHGVR